MLDQKCLTPGGGGAAIPERHERTTISEIGSRRARQRGKGWREIYVAAQGIHHAADAHTGPAHDERHANVFFVRRLFAEQEPMFAEMKPIVGSKDDVSA